MGPVTSDAIRSHLAPHINLPGDSGGDEGGAAFFEKADGLLCIVLKCFHS